MEPILLLTYLAVSHYSCYIVTNIYDYIIIQRNFRSLENELTFIRNELERINTNDCQKNEYQNNE
jgi:hypothetical protein